MSVTCFLGQVGGYHGDRPHTHTFPAHGIIDYVKYRIRNTIDMDRKRLSNYYVTSALRFSAYLSVIWCSCKKKTMVAMCSEKVKTVLAGALKCEDFALERPRIVNAKSLATELLHRIESSDEIKAKFDVFSKRLMELLETTYTSDRRLKHSTKRKRMWTAYHLLKGKQLPPLWSSFIHQDAGLQNDDIGESQLACLPSSSTFFF